MGLLNKSVQTQDENFLRIKKDSQEIVVALAGNPNVGKSTVFNALTGMNQHTGNWPGKTVTSARGQYEYKGFTHILVDVPGTYSLMANSTDEEVARDFICFGGADVCIVVVDATCLERNLNLVLQILEYTRRTVVCLNLMDEAEKKNIHIDADRLARELGVQVVCTSARSGKGLADLQEAVRRAAMQETTPQFSATEYDESVENAIACVSDCLPVTAIDSRWLSLKLLEKDDTLNARICEYLGFDILDNDRLRLVLAHTQLDGLRDSVVSGIVARAEKIYRGCVSVKNGYDKRDRRADKILTSKAVGIPLMLLLLCGIFWLTIVGANYPSQLLSDGLFWLGDRLRDFFIYICMPQTIINVIVDGVYKTLAWVVSVMLPPMAIFFPLFTLLEDVGYLPRIAFNLDRFFCKAGAHGKQALTMCMGFGCNACGVTGCRIIDSPRERLIAVLTNNFVPCNGRFPTLIAIITMFFAGMGGIMGSSVSALILMGVILLGVLMTFAVSKLLSCTLLRGTPSSFSLELPPYRKPKFGSVIVRSIFDRTLFVLGRAIAVAAPAGLIIWLCANISVGGASILSWCTGFLDPFAQIFGMDGVILMAFILGFPANEIVVPIILMAYMCAGTMVEYDSLESLRLLLVDNGWTLCTALCTMLFSLFHFPCATTCLTIRKETGSFKWTAVSVLLPTAIGLALCAIVNLIL